MHLEVSQGFVYLWVKLIMNVKEWLWLMSISFPRICLLVSEADYECKRVSYMSKQDANSIHNFKFQCYLRTYFFIHGTSIMCKIFMCMIYTYHALMWQLNIGRYLVWFFLAQWMLILESSYYIDMECSNNAKEISRNWLFVGILSNPWLLNIHLISGNFCLRP